MKTLNLLITLFCIFLISACSFHSVKLTYNKPLLQCQNHVTQQIRQLEVTGYLDAQDHFIEYFEFLAIDRFLAQLYSQAINKPQRQEWLRLAFEKAQLKTLLSLQNLSNDKNKIVQFKSCSKKLYKNLYKKPEVLWSQVSSEHIVPNDNYSTLARFFGGYWVAKWIAAPSIENEKSQALELWKNTNNSSQTFTTWGSLTNRNRSPNKDNTVNNSTYKQEFQKAYKKSPLQLPVLSEAKLNQLTQYHAPQWRVSTSIDAHKTHVNNSINSLGTPKFKDEWYINNQQASVFTHSGFTLFEGKKLLQLSYLVWFPQAQYKQNGTDWYGGKFDGIYWRITLDTDGTALLYDSIHACGCYHTVMVNPNRISLKLKTGSEQPILAPVPWVNGPVQLTLRRDRHWLIGVAPQQQNINHHIALKPLDSLRSLETPQGFKSFYDDSGYVKGSERKERFFLWPFGVDNAGAMRQWGQHATAFIGKRHFDDATWPDDFFIRVQK
jgi:hypothetical protein